ncbi:hypothetical protein GCM10011369_12230 [Neiella marina]|uniref:Uncharacterized protein n=1 Tax=Neiella marina TaxID=508461 RepID=A0A8J2U3X5_9GAMM|nr:hypothetical protein GCM10011369_12230 [Neiella marina]
MGKKKPVFGTRANSIVGCKTYVLKIVHIAVTGQFQIVTNCCKGAVEFSSPINLATDNGACGT